MITTPAVDLALSGDRPLTFGAFAIDLPGYSIRLIQGSAEVMIEGEKYVGFDETFGAIGAVDIGDEGIGDDAPTMQLTIHPASLAAVSTLAAADMQGSPVRFMLCALDRETGQVIPDPIECFVGELDTPTVHFGKATTLIYDCVSGFVAFQTSDEAMRLSDAFHTSIFPGETGMANHTAIVKTITWGANPVTGSVAMGGGATSFNYRLAA